MCDVASTAVFCNESIQCFPGTASKFFFRLLVTISVAPVITGIIVHFRFHIRCISIHKLLYFNFFSASFCTTIIIIIIIIIITFDISNEWEQNQTKLKMNCKAAQLFTIQYAFRPDIIMFYISTRISKGWRGSHVRSFSQTVNKQCVANSAISQFKASKKSSITLWCQRYTQSNVVYKVRSRL